MARSSGDEDAWSLSSSGGSVNLEAEQIPSSVHRPLIDLQLSASMSPSSVYPDSGSGRPSRDYQASSSARVQDAVRSWQDRRGQGHTHSRGGKELKESPEERLHRPPGHRAGASAVTAGETIFAFHSHIRSKPQPRPKPVQRQASPTSVGDGVYSRAVVELTPEQKVAKQASLFAEGRVQDLVPGSMKHLARLNRECNVNGKPFERIERSRHEPMRKTRAFTQQEMNKKFQFGKFTVVDVSVGGTTRNVPSRTKAAQEPTEDDHVTRQPDGLFSNLSPRALILLHSLTYVYALYVCTMLLGSSSILAMCMCGLPFPRLPCRFPDHCKSETRERTHRRFHTHTSNTHPQLNHAPPLFSSICQESEQAGARACDPGRIAAASPASFSLHLPVFNPLPSLTSSSACPSGSSHVSSLPQSNVILNAHSCLLYYHLQKRAYGGVGENAGSHLSSLSALPACEVSLPASSLLACS